MNGVNTSRSDPRPTAREHREFAWRATWDALEKCCEVSAAERRLALIDGVSYIEDLARALGGPLDGGLRKACLRAATQLGRALPSEFADAIVDRNIAAHGALAPTAEESVARVRIMRRVFFLLYDSRGYRYVPACSLEFFAEKYAPVDAPAVIVSHPALLTGALFAVGFFGSSSVAASATSIVVFLLSEMSRGAREEALPRLLLSVGLALIVGLAALLVFHRQLHLSRPTLAAVEHHHGGMISSIASMLLAFMGIWPNWWSA